MAVAETQAAVDVRDALSEQVSIDSAIQEGLEDLDAAQQVADAAAQALEAAESALENASTPEEIAAAEEQIAASQAAVDDS